MDAHGGIKQPVFVSVYIDDLNEIKYLELGMCFPSSVA